MTKERRAEALPADPGSNLFVDVVVDVESPEDLVVIHMQAPR